MHYKSMWFTISTYEVFDIISFKNMGGLRGNSQEHLREYNFSSSE